MVQDQKLTDLLGNMNNYKIPDIREETEKRVALLKKAKDKPKLQAIEIEMCKRDILYWCREYVYTDKNSTLFTDDV